MRSFITKFQTIEPRPEHAGQPRARGEVTLVSKKAQGRGVIDRLYQSGSARCLFPRGSGASLNAVFLNTAGGVTGGDKMKFSATAGVDTALTITTQACERVYKAQPGQLGQIRNTLNVRRGARLNWMPQETILFEGSALDRRLKVSLHDDAQLLIVEPVVFGRTAMGETLRNCLFRDRIEISRDACPIYIDAVRMEGDVTEHLARANVADGAGAVASVVFASPHANAFSGRVRDLLPRTAGASMLASDLLVVRLLAADSFALRKALLPVLSLLSETEIPRCWMI